MEIKEGVEGLWADTERIDPPGEFHLIEAAREVCVSAGFIRPIAVVSDGR